MEVFRVDGQHDVDVHKSGDPHSPFVVIMLNGVGQQFCHWPSALLSELERVAYVLRMDFRGLLTPDYKPEIKDIIDDVAMVRAWVLNEPKSRWRKYRNRELDRSPDGRVHIQREARGERPAFFLLGYSFGGIATQLVLSDPRLRNKFKGFVLIATASEFVPESFARTFAGPGTAPLGTGDVIKTVFFQREVPAGRVESFVDGTPTAWSVITLPREGPQPFAWKESFLQYGARKLQWLVPQGRVGFVCGRAFRDYMRCPATPDHFSPRYVDFASTLMTDPATGRPGKGLLAARLAKIGRSNLERADRRILVVSGSQDGLFPIEHFARLVQALVGKAEGGLTPVVYQAQDEELPVLDALERETGVRVLRVPGEAGGHALLFQDGIAEGFAKLLVAWITDK